ncbi:MAG: sensor domain-containing diguanylate cyclase [Deltaproteobacteria bacterium]|nr:sensor domain-containing diguanylate cyclase [Deltaproteobacteria bacterium]
MESAPKPDFRIVFRAASLLNSSLDLDVVLRELLDGLDRLLRPTHWSLLLRDDATGELVFTLVRGDAHPQLLARRLAPEEGIAGWVASHDEALLIPDVAADPRFSARMDTLSGFRTRSVVAVPLRARARCIGVLEIVNAMHERVFDATDLEILQSYADFAAIAIHNARTHEAIVELAKNDPLTGLRNSQYFIRAIEEAIARGGRFAIVFFDMDRFKRLVDTHGHVRGSAALAEVGRWLGAELAPGEVGCRFGGDEFALLFAGADRAAADTRCRDLATRLLARTFLDDEGIHATLGASFGAAAFPADGGTPAALLHLADERMYASKRARQLARRAD